jgi:DNA polymerase
MPKSIDPARQLSQRLDSLRRAGLDWLPGARPSVETPTSSDPDPTLISETVSMPRITSQGPNLFAAPLEQTPGLPAPERGHVLATLRALVADCTRCPALASTRTQTVFGEGNHSARLMFIGEAPGADEDRLGRPFVGRAGRLLDDMITKGMGLRREDVYIANILKCRPPENRVPMADEVAHCRGYLDQQIEIVRPEFLCLLGKTAAAALLDTKDPMGKLRGRWFRYREVRTLVIYHPAYLLRDPSKKREAWEDLKLLMGAMGLEIKPRGSG